MDLTVETFCDYLSAIRPPNTVRAYRVGANHLVEYVSADRVDIRKSPALFLGFVPWLLRVKKLKPKSLEVVLPGAMKYLEWRRAHGDPLPVFAKPDLPRSRREPPAIVKAAAMRAYIHLATVAEEPFRTAALTLPFTGLRSDEHCRLLLEQVRRDPSDPRGQRLMFVGIEGKSKQIRDVQIVDPGSAILFAYLTGWRRGIFESPWVFPSERNSKRRYQDRTLRRKIDDIERTIGAPGPLSPRVLRHTWGTALAEYGVPMHHVAQLAGHESIETTYKYYIGRAEQAKLGAEVSKVKIYEEE